MIEGYPLSPQQRGVWPAQESEGDALRVECVLRLDGQVDPDALRAAAETVVARHDALRTRFRRPSWARLPVQEVTAEPRLRWRHVTGPCGTSAAELAAAGGPVAVDAEGAPPLAAVLAGAGEEWRLLLRLPAVCGDPRSLTNVVRELVAAYEDPASPGPDALQYPRFAEWRNRLLEEASEEERELWRGRLLQAGRLPLEGRPAEGTNGFVPCLVQRRVGGRLRSRLERLAGGSLDGLLLAAWQGLLARLAVGGLPGVFALHHGRKFEELSTAVGLYATYLPVAVSPPADLPFGDWVRRLERGWEELTLEQETFDPALAAGDGDLVLFDWDEHPKPGEARGVRFTTVERRFHLGRYHLRLAAAVREGDLLLSFCFDPRRFARSQVQRLAGWMEGLLAAAEPDTLVGRLPFLGPAERHLLQVEWQGGPPAAPEAATLPELLTASTRRAPERTAFVHGADHLTFAELERRGRRLAERLQVHGVGPDSRVALLLERGVEVSVAIVGTVLAGAAFVPLDPGQPRSRLRLMLEECGACAVVTQERLAGRLPAGGPPVVEVGRRERSGPPNAAPTPPLRSPAAENLAYVVFTSGSTGRPRGVMVEHRSALDLVSSLESTVYRDLPGPRRLSLNAPLAFDGAMKQVLALVAGHTLEVVPEEVRPDGDALGEWIAAHALDVFDCTPAQLALLLRAGSPGRAAAAPARVLVGGEDIDPATWNRLAADLPGRYWNVYGPTECTVDVTAQRISESPAPALGRPLPGVGAYVLDRWLQPVPCGVPGVLYLSGPGLARGYTARPAVTAGSFLPHPFAGAPGERLYRSGDLVHHLPEGRLRFLGREDHQVKVRGVRVELGEVEAALRQHPEVRDAAVVLERGERSEEGTLRAYWAPARPGGPSGRDLQAFLRERLPEYMVPASVAGLRRMPLTRNGKVDRGALAAAERVDTAEHAAETPPRTPFEEAMVELWTDLLGAERVGVEHHFFEMGGHSLLATRLMSRVRRTFGVDLPLRALFDEPTLAGFARRVAGAVAAGRRPALPDIEPVPREGELPLSFAQGRLWVAEAMEPGSAAYNVPAAVRLRGELSVPALTAALEEVERRHEILRTSYPDHDGRPRQRIAPPGPCGPPVVDLSGLESDARARTSEGLLDRESRRPFDLSRGPLMRVVLFRLAAREHLALIVLHHIVADGWSCSVLVREVAALYASRREGRPSPLPELAVQYADFAAWQRRVLEGEAVEALLLYWRRQLAGLPRRLELPTDRPRREGGRLEGGMRVHRVPGPIAASLRSLARERGATLFMVLLASFQLLLARYSGQDDVAVGTDVAGRDRVELEPLIGFFVNLLVLRARIRAGETFAGLLDRARETVLEAYAHQDLPFEKLVEALRPDRRSSAMPLIQALLVMQNTPRGELELPGLVLEPLDLETGSAKFEIALFASEEEGGITLGWNYSRDLFDPATVDRMAQRYTELLARVAEAPDSTVEEIGREIDLERKARTMASTGRRASKLERFLQSSPTGIERNRLVEFDSPASGGLLPLTARPADGVELDPVEWARAQREEVEEKLAVHGAVRFRDFPLPTTADFERFAATLCPELFDEYGDLPQEGSSTRVYRSTPYPPDKWILFHNESSHMHRWPMKQFFYCVRPSDQGGETPLLDCRESLRALPAEVVGRLRSKGLIYVRNFTDGLDVSWQDFFRTEDRGAVERYCLGAGIEFEWRPGGGLCTRQRALAVAHHPRTGVEVFFNQLQLHHPAALDPEVRRSMEGVFGAGEMPRNVLYGDGTPIEDEVIEEIGRVYQEIAVVEPWQQGDVVMLDNMLTAHARKPFSGERKIVVAMGEMVTLQEARAAS